MKTTYKWTATFALLSFALCNPAFAKETASAPYPVSANVAVEIMAAIEDPIQIDQMAHGLISNDDLALLRGGQAIVLSNQTLTAIVNGNVLNGNYVAGQISLTDNALSNFSGMGNFVINTGAQNNLQSAMNVTINFAQ